jgi:hypothetical protein
LHDHCVPRHPKASSNQRGCFTRVPQKMGTRGARIWGLSRVFGRAAVMGSCYYGGLGGAG